MVWFSPNLVITCISDSYSTRWCTLPPKSLIFFQLNFQPWIHFCSDKWSKHQPAWLSIHLCSAWPGFTASTISFPLEVARKRLMVGALKGKCPCKWDVGCLCVARCLRFAFLPKCSLVVCNFQGLKSHLKCTPTKKKNLNCHFIYFMFAKYSLLK